VRSPGGCRDALSVIAAITNRLLHQVSVLARRVEDDNDPVGGPVLMRLSQSDFDMHASVVELCSRDRPDAEREREELRTMCIRQADARHCGLGSTLDRLDVSAVISRARRIGTEESAAHESAHESA
jgi:hypothetical protein